MAKMKHIQELLSTELGVEGSLLIVKKIHDTLIEEVNKRLIPRTEASFVAGPTNIPGSSLDIDLETPNTMDVREVAEGADIVIDNQDYSTLNVKPVKYGVAIRITKEMLEDGKWNLLDRNLKTAGKRLAENENSLVIAQLDTAANSVSGAAAITIANITEAMQNLEDNDYEPTTFIIGNEVLNDLRNIDTFVEANKLGSREMLQSGFVGRLYGLNVIRVSANAGMTTTTSYVIDKSQAYMIAEKRPMTVERFELPSNDMSAASITQRIAAKTLRTEAIAKITTS